MYFSKTMYTNASNLPTYSGLIIMLTLNVLFGLIFNGNYSSSYRYIYTSGELVIISLMIILPSFFSFSLVILILVSFGDIISIGS